MNVAESTRSFKTFLEPNATESFNERSVLATLMRVVLIARNQELRIASAVVRAHDFCDRVTVLNLNPEDEDTVNYAEQAGADVILHEGSTDAPALASVILQSVKEGERTILIALDSDWKLSDMARTVGLSRQGHDVFLAFKHRTINRRKELDNTEAEPLTSDTYSYAEADIQFAFVSEVGLKAIAEQDSNDVPSDIDSEIDLRVVELDKPTGPPSRESLASASRFAQFFYWMLESRHPLILFGVPGIIFFLLGFEMAREIIAFGGPHDSVSLGVALAAFVTTFVGVFSLTASMILYVLGKQIDRMPKPVD